MSRRLIVTGGSIPRELVLVDTIVVGRDPACDITETKDPLLSRRHASFTASAGGVVVRDLGSRNGILVNGDKAPEATLRSGDVVQIGHLQVRFVDEVGPFVDVPIVDVPTVVSAPPPPPAAPPRSSVHDAPTQALDSPTIAPGDAVTKKLSL